MDRKINIIDFETGKSVSITVDEEDMIDTLLNKVRNYWLKDGDYVLAYSGEMLAPVCLVKDYDIMDEDILQLRARSSLEASELKTLEPSRPEGIIFPKSCPNCGPVEFRYVSASEFQCRNCGGMLQKRPDYKSIDPLDSFLAAGESFMGHIPPENTPEETDFAYDEAVTNTDYSNWESTESYTQENNFTPPPRIVASLDKSPLVLLDTPTSVSLQDNAMKDEEESPATERLRRPPRIVGSSDESGKKITAIQIRTSEDTEKTPVLVPESSAAKIPSCEDCGEAMRFIRLYAMWWCDRCEKYQGEEEEQNESDTIIDNKGDNESKNEDSIFILRRTPTPFHPVEDTQAKDTNNSLSADSTTNMNKEEKDFQPDGDQDSGLPKENEEVTTANKGKENQPNEDTEELIELSAIPLVEDEDNEFLIHRGREWLIEFMKMSNPIKTRTRWTDDMLRIEFRDDKDRLCILEIDRSGEDIKPMFYRSSSYRKGGFSEYEENLF